MACWRCTRDLGAGDHRSFLMRQTNRVRPLQSQAGCTQMAPGPTSTSSSTHRCRRNLPSACVGSADELQVSPGRPACLPQDLAPALSAMGLRLDALCGATRQHCAAPQRWSARCRQDLPQRHSRTSHQPRARLTGTIRVLWSVQAGSLATRSVVSALSRKIAL